MDRKALAGTHCLDSCSWASALAMLAGQLGTELGAGPADGCGRSFFLVIGDRPAVATRRALAARRAIWFCLSRRRSFCCTPTGSSCLRDSWPLFIVAAGVSLSDGSAGRPGSAGAAVGAAESGKGTAMSTESRATFRLTPQIILGLCIVAFGVALTARQPRRCDASRILEWFWPVGIVAGRRHKLLQSDQGAGRVVGGVITFVGVALLGDVARTSSRSGPGGRSAMIALGSGHRLSRAFGGNRESTRLPWPAGLTPAGGPGRDDRREPAL